MKRAHIVYAHPEPNSFVAAMRDMTKEALEKDGWQTSVTDLQAINFDAVASADDFGTRSREDYLVYPLEQRHAWQNKTLDPQIAAEVEAVRNAACAASARWLWRPWAGATTCSAPARSMAT
jgi:NAD(P)H dehydrogenase (quinone)